MTKSHELVKLADWQGSLLLKRGLIDEAICKHLECLKIAEKRGYWKLYGIVSTHLVQDLRENKKNEEALGCAQRSLLAMRGHETECKNEIADLQKSIKSLGG